MKKTNGFLMTCGLRFLVLCALLALSASVFSGCSVKSAEVTTELTISKDFDGVRHMTIGIPQKTFDKYISSSWGETAVLLKNGCPEELSCEVSETNAMYMIDFKLEFESLEDYRTKAEALLGRTVDISVDSPDNVFASGIVIHEDFSSIELLDWLPDMISENGYISAENADKLLINGSNTAIYDGDTYRNLDEYISISDLKALAINSITINTLVNADRTFNREVIIDLPIDSVNENGDAIREYLEGNLVDGVEGTWKERSKKCTFTVSIERKSINELQEFTAKLLDNENCMTNYSDAVSDGTLLDIMLNFDEELFFDSFTAEGVGEVPVKYNFDIEDLNEISVFVSTDGGKMKCFEVDELSGYTTLADANMSRMNMRISMSRCYVADCILADTVVSGDDEITRDIVFELSQLPTEFEQEIINSRFVTEEQENIKKETKVTDGKFCLTVKLSGTEAEVSESFNEVFGVEGALCYKLNEADSGKTFSYNESVDFSNCIPVSENVVLNYTLKADGFKFDNDMMKLSAPTVKSIKGDGKIVSCTVYGKYLSIETGGVRAGSSWIWIAVAVLVTAAVVAVVVIVLKKKGSGRRHKVRKIKAQEKEMVGSEADREI